MPWPIRRSLVFRNVRASRASAAGSFPAVTPIGWSCRVRKALTRPVPLSLLDEGAAGRAGTAFPTRLEVGRAGRGTVLGGCRTSLQAGEVIGGAPASRYAGPRLRHHALGACRQVRTASAEAAVRWWSRGRRRIACPDAADEIRLTAGLGGPGRSRARLHADTERGGLRVRAAVLLAGQLRHACRLHAGLLLAAAAGRAGQRSAGATRQRQDRPQRCDGEHDSESFHFAKSPLGWEFEDTRQQRTCPRSPLKTHARWRDHARMRLHGCTATRTCATLLARSSVEICLVAQPK